MIDADRLKKNWSLVAARGDQVPLYFYSTLFLSYPETRDLFPMNMAAQRDKLVNALGAVVSNVDTIDAVVPTLQALGRDHRKFGALRGHYPAVGEALLATLEHFSGAHWTPAIAADWAAAYELVAATMADAADAAAHYTPAWWDAEVVGHERRDLETAIITIAPGTRLDYVAGQSVSLCTSLRPRAWRQYSPANAPRNDGTIELHVRAVDGGEVSSALVSLLRPGDSLRVGPAFGSGLTLRPGSGPVAMIAGGTGVAPMKALIEQIAATPRPVSLYWGARSPAGLYCLDQMQALAARFEWLELVPCVDEDMFGSGVRVGSPAELAVAHGRCTGADVYLCGPTGMVESSGKYLVGAGVRADAIHFEPTGA
ncbi:globin domain-containing protein [Glycomyces sp. NPDC047010]|uniref:globin domain-containing protein n=1 Tax=Glycomyces sp. NPDC047010 TaxID=3155023 RepID=UPI00340465BC